MESLCVEIINDVEEMIKTGTEKEEIIEYLEKKREDIRKYSKDKCSEYVDKLVSELR